MPNREIVLNQESVKMTSPTTEKQRPSLTTSAMTRTQVHLRRYRTVTNGDHHQHTADRWFSKFSSESMITPNRVSTVLDVIFISSKDTTSRLLVLSDR